MSGVSWAFLYRGVLGVAGSIIAVALIMAVTSLLRDRWQPTHLEQVKRSGELRVLTRYGPTTFYATAENYAGTEYALVRRFARRLGVKPRFIVVSSLPDLLARALAGEADLAAAGLTVTETRRQYLRFSIPYQTVTEQLIYHSRNPPPRSVADLSGGLLEVMTGSSHVHTLETLKRRHPGLTWHHASPASGAEGLLRWLERGLIDYTVLDSHLFATLNRFYPRLRVAFDLTGPRPLAWAFSKRHDGSLLKAADDFFQTLRQNGILAQLQERYYGHVDGLNYADVCVFRRHFKTHLPRYRPLFEEAARRHGWDWRLLAAIAYQESHWVMDARSPTGVRGLMMLTRRTARRVKVKDRLDPRESVLGGTRYLTKLRNKIPDRIPEPDRTWFALAAYNIGFGHLEDARILTQAAGDDPDRWVDVKEYLPLLTRKAWYRRVRYGYARGDEPVRYVENIRNYYDLLLWLTESSDPAFRPAEPQGAIIPSPDRRSGSNSVGLPTVVMPAPL